MRIDSPLPIQDPSNWWLTQLGEETLTEGSTSRDLSQHTSTIAERWTLSLRTIPTEEEWYQWLDLRIKEVFQEQ